MQTLDRQLFTLVKRSARRQGAAENGSEIVFRACWQAKATIAFIVVGCGLLVSVLLGATPVPGNSPYVGILLASLVGALPLAILLALPGRVVVDSSGIRQRYWWRPLKFIGWSDFAAVIHDRNDGSTIVYGKFGPPIVFSPYLVDQLSFDREVRARPRIDEIRGDL
jgi:hypothetical protein